MFNPAAGSAKSISESGLGVRVFYRDALGTVRTMGQKLNVCGKRALLVIDTIDINKIRKSCIAINNCTDLIFNALPSNVIVFPWD
jgi:hypothetical protein